ncbi:hypothetical protein FPHYL_562 [Fusarium phyllophilum]|uniref:CID domain-containing protein n=1 Tax=Fusarium phyllophilum TaxID=47803 RepID=A0A8H5KFV6_9HYPO|nr:hypothetical protein FPHYL_562 [Fusarium phyllophilum]
MATPELAIAKATLSATLFRADPTSLSRPEVDAFFPILTDALAKCSRPNVQKCKVWIIDKIAPSAARTTALAKYFNALSKSLQDDGSRPSLKRRRLHLLYVLNDVLYHSVTRNDDFKFATSWEPVLPGMIASAAAFDNCPKHKQKIADLIRLWEDQQYVNSSFAKKLEDALASGVAPQTAQEAQASNVTLKLAKDAPFTLPSFHGDSTVPWYDLPATTWLPHLTPNSTKPMFPDQIRPIQLAAGPADKVLVNAVQDLLGEVERMFSKEQKWNDEPGNDLNELGERVVLDEITGEVIGGDTYYGWSRVVRAPYLAAILEDDHEVLRGPPISAEELLKGLGVEVFPAAEAGHIVLITIAAQNAHAVPATAGVEVGVEVDKDPQDRPHRPPPPPQQAPPAPFPPIPPPGDFPAPPPPPAGYQGPWPPPPPPPHMAQGWFPPNPAMMGQMMGGWNVPPPPPPPHNGYQGRGRGNGYRGRGRGGYDRGRGW